MWKSVQGSKGMGTRLARGMSLERKGKEGEDREVEKVATSRASTLFHGLGSHSKRARKEGGGGGGAGAVKGLDLPQENPVKVHVKEGHGVETEWEKEREKVRTGKSRRQGAMGKLGGGSRGGEVFGVWGRN